VSRLALRSGNGASHKAQNLSSLIKTQKNVFKKTTDKRSFSFKKISSHFYGYKKITGLPHDLGRLLFP